MTIYGLGFVVVLNRFRHNINSHVLYVVLHYIAFQWTILGLRLNVTFGLCRAFKCYIHIRHIVIHDLCTVHHLVKCFTIDFALIFMSYFILSLELCYHVQSQIFQPTCTCFETEIFILKFLIADCFPMFKFLDSSYSYGVYLTKVLLKF
jgi:hypothetical protein